MGSFGVFLRGMAMGAADVVPGVSGGTVALITGIYERLVDSIRAFDIRCLKLVAKGQLGTAWKKVNGTFLLALILGIATSLFSLARLINLALEQYPVEVFALFSGLIFASSIFLFNETRIRSVSSMLALACGFIAMYALSEIRPMHIDPNPLIIFLSGAIAICAMILPGISGSFLLLMMGMYQVVLRAVEQLDLFTLLIFASGCGVGLLSFVRLLSWLLHHHRVNVMSFLVGVLFASLKVLWPWQGRSIDSTFQVITAIAVFILGTLIVVILHRVANRPVVLAR